MDLTPEVLEGAALSGDILRAPSRAAPITGHGPGGWASGVEEREVALMMAAFHSTGGIASDDYVVRLLRERGDQPLSVLARWIVSRSVVNFVWQRRIWLPLFQFSRADMSVQQGPLRIVQELTGVFSDWELAVWFASPNSMLGNAAPVEVIRIDWQGVWQAARIDRFIAAG